MNEEYLATGFADVDGREDGSAYTRCLSLIDSLPYYRYWKEESYRLLDLSPGQSALDVGCGLGDDVFRMARLVDPGGFAVGIDTSSRMVTEAGHRTPPGLSAQFRQADARNLPFDNGYFTRCRVDRTLQHVSSPGLAIKEMVRVLAPHGLLLAYDNDWGTFSLSGADRETTRIVETTWQDSFTNPWIGRYLTSCFLDAGLVDIEVYPSVSLLTDYELADKVYNIAQTVGRAVRTGSLDDGDAARWLEDLKTRSRTGRFFCTLTAFTVKGRKEA